MRHLWNRQYLAVMASVLLLLTPSAYADGATQPSKAYQKCKSSLEKSAAVHRERTTKARIKHERKIAQLLGQSGDQSGMAMAVERIRDWRDVEQAQNTYIDKIIADIDELVAPDGPDFSCLDRGRVLKVYQGNQRAYARVLEEVEADLEQRLDLENLDDDEGLVIVSFDTTTLLTFVRINRRHTLGGNIEFSPLRVGQYFRVVKAKAGTYAWNLASRDLGNFVYRQYDLSRFNLTFDVKPGVINYAGTFLMEADSRRFSVDLTDRLVIALHMLESRYPELMQDYEIANGLFPDDRFIEFYLREIRLLEEEASASGE